MEFFKYVFQSVIKLFQIEFEMYGYTFTFLKILISLAVLSIIIGLITAILDRG